MVFTAKIYIMQSTCTPSNGLDSTNPIVARCINGYSARALSLRFLCMQAKYTRQQSREEDHSCGNPAVPQASITKYRANAPHGTHELWSPILCKS